jgi:hypothetical protein
MDKNEKDWAAWARENRVAFDVDPLLELVEGERRQVGFALKLFCAVPRADATGTHREQGDALRDELSVFLAAAFPVDERVARTEREPGRTVVARAENGLQPEIGVTFRIFHGDEYLKTVTNEDRQGLTRVEKRLVELGLRRGHW